MFNLVRYEHKFVESVNPLLPYALGMLEGANVQLHLTHTQLFH